jgi:hypothetical protein
MFKYMRPFIAKFLVDVYVNYQELIIIGTVTLKSNSKNEINVDFKCALCDNDLNK